MEYLLLSPHNDDAALFAAFTCIKFRPYVITVWKSVSQEHYGFGITAAEREREDEAAMAILGCSWEQWPYPDWRADGGNDLAGIADRLHSLAQDPELIRVFAPAEETGAHPQHNELAVLADAAFGHARVTHYLTYVNGRSKSDLGIQADFVDSWIESKHRALACYSSQMALTSTSHHFMQNLYEWYAE